MISRNSKLILRRVFYITVNLILLIAGIMDREWGWAIGQAIFLGAQTTLLLIVLKEGRDNAKNKVGK